MSKLEFNFGEDSFNTLFPFFILVDSSLAVKGIGKSLAKICPTVQVEDNFFDNFTIERPFLEKASYKDLIDNIDQLIILKFKKDQTPLRGQFQLVEGAVLFVGTPWFISMEEVLERKLTMNDFALNDPLIDLLHVLNNQEITAQELKETLKTVNNQKNKLKKDGAELKRLALVASANENGVVFTSPDAEIFWCNDSYLEMTGYTKEDVIGKSPLAVGLSEFSDMKQVDKAVELYFQREAFSIEMEHRKKEAGYFWSKIKVNPIFDAKGEIVQYFAMIEDITAKKNADFKLIESEKRLSFLIRNLQTGVTLEDENRKVVLANKTFCTMFDLGEDPDVLIGTSQVNTAEFSKKFVKYPDAFSKRLNTIFKRQKPVYDEEIELADGRVLERSYIPVFRDGVYKGNLRSYLDVTIKKKHEQSIELEKEKYRRVIANMNLGLAEVDKYDTITLVNQSFCELSGYSAEELIGKKAYDVLVAKESKQEIKDRLINRSKGISDSYELAVINKKGEKRDWLISGAPNYNINGKLIGSIGVHLDITDKKQQEEKLYLLSLIAERNINAVVVCDNQGKIDWINTSFVEMTGYSSEEMIGRKPGDFLQGPETDMKTVDYMRERIAKGLPFNCEVINYSKKGREYWVSIQGQALYNKDNEIVKYFAIEEDITNKKNSENQREVLVKNLAISNKKLEDYAHIVSHDLKSPLRSIHSLLAWIKEDNIKEFSEQTLDYFGLIENKVEKMDHLIDGILTYAKIDKIDMTQEKVNVRDVVENIINIIHIPKSSIVSIKGSLPIIKADRFRMQQLFQNIISNAVNHNDKAEGVVVIDCVETPKDYTFSIADNGCGIAKEDQERIFNTFQSLTNNDKSSGLGLSIVKKIVDSYQGKIWVESEVAKGTTFFIRLSK